jgi:hypothetical protein
MPKMRQTRVSLILRIHKILLDGTSGYKEKCISVMGKGPKCSIMLL